MKNIEYKFKINGTAMSFWKGTSNKTIIFAPGLPQYITSYHPFVSVLISLGYNLLIPKYYGTWESNGTFQIKTSIKSIYNALKIAQLGKATELFNNSEINIPNKNISLLGFSYGGLIALLTDFPVDKKILLMPFLNFEFHNKEKFKMELSFIRNAYSEVYRFNKAYFLSELKKIKYPKILNNSNKIKVVFGKKDKIISKEEIAWFLKKYNTKVVMLNSSHTVNLSLKEFKQILT